MDARKKQKQMQVKAERQHRWEVETALHPIDQEEKQRLYDAKIAAKKQQQQELEDRLNTAMAIGLRVVVDLDFLNHQTLRERNSVFKQVATAYGTMKKCSFPNLLSLHLASYRGDVAAFCDQRGARAWKVSRHEQPLFELFPNDTVIFLSPDAPTVLTELDPNAVYVIGGIVDRTVRKSQTLAKATASAIRTARLPVQEHLRVKSHVLNIDTVLLILLEVHNHGDWNRAFDAVLPKRFRRPE
ncbi:hypothetical protein H310_09130 [Aphanomyces invadans]|uniref:tRNA (guanine(9)-N(1))-methyltransferase n=1 Tax=Aphanomyces invadans TaxID=157072 RepID=A0A024TUR9_9STRA|nr:hypothetical protein H310_09130 [Aphanomyces invadans]ETV97778.1 hypothetical protein H310_09130 [Aphanomyces invadans]|eukprot:XP_008873339.1 hypothetical protein H310_09130 [Aphanomyces invadans]